MYKKLLAKENIKYLLVPSTNRFLVEYSPLDENSRYVLTNFSGSAGDALVTPDTIFLFVDGRYHIQADNQVDHNKVTVVKLQSGQNFYDELIKKIPKDQTLGVFSKKISQRDLEYLQNNGLKIKLIDNDPLSKDSSKYNSNITNTDGLSASQKIADIKGTLILTNLEEVSYLFNKRNLKKNFSSAVKGKAIIQNGKAKRVSSIEDFAKTHKGKIYTDKSAINAYDYSLIKDRAINIESPIKRMKAIKTENEITHYKSAFKRTDKTLKSIREYIENNDKLSEFDITKQLEKEFLKFGAKTLSFKPIVAIDENSALAHYSKCSKDKYIKDGSLILIDCGAYYEQGLATDITRVFVKGSPNDLQKRVYTTVLKMLLNSYKYNDWIATPYRACNDIAITGFKLDELARKIYSANNIDGFVFNHGLGHGIGINVHEYPPNLSPNKKAEVTIEKNMCFTIEPGLYCENKFGIRLENACYFNGKEIKSFTKMNFEKKLVDMSILTKQEKIWLNEFEVI